MDNNRHILENPCRIDARVVAVEVSTRYLSSLDHSLPHSRNIAESMLPFVEQVTQMILCFAPTEEIETEKVFANAVGDEDCGVGTAVDKAHKSSCAEGKVFSGSGVGSSRRAKARMDAFLGGLALAVPADPVVSRRQVTPRTPPRQAQVAVSSLISNALPALASMRIIHAVGEECQNQLVEPSTTTENNSSLQAPKEKYSPPKNSLDRLRQCRALYRYPQIDHDDLVLRLELYLRSILRLRNQFLQGADSTTELKGFSVPAVEECSVHVESKKLLKGRVDGLLRSFVHNVSCVSSIQPVLTGLLDFLTKEVLAVDMLGEELKGAIKRLVAEYEMQTSFASIAFLSSPEQSAGSTLQPLLMSYLRYLQSDWKHLVFGCELERMLSAAIDAELRHAFKTTEFRSVGHLLDVCHERRHMLDRIELAPAALEDMNGSNALVLRENDPKAVKQALRDLRRETITVNGKILPPAHSLRQLVKNLAEALNSKTTEEGPTDSTASRLFRGNSKPTMMNADGGVSSSSKEGSDVFILFDSESDHQSSGNEGATSDNGEEKSGKLVTLKLNDNTTVEPSKPRRRPRRRSSFDIRTIDKMTLRLLIASCRTGTGGDAFFVVQDLFGGEEVVVVSSTCSTGNRGTTHRTRKKKKHQGTIEITVRLSSIEIEVHGTYNVFPNDMPDDCCEPLIQLHTTTKETISLQQVRVPQTSDVLSETEGSTLVLREKITDTTGKRILTIRPARYEKVQVWNTPS